MQVWILHGNCWHEEYPDVRCWTQIKHILRSSWMLLRWIELHDTVWVMGNLKGDESRWLTNKIQHRTITCIHIICAYTQENNSHRVYAKCSIHDDTLFFQVPTNYSLGVVMALGALVCWGSWSVTLVLATSKALRDPKDSFMCQRKISEEISFMIFLQLACTYDSSHIKYMNSTNDFSWYWHILNTIHLQTPILATVLAVGHSRRKECPFSSLAQTHFDVLSLFSALCGGWSLELYDLDIFAITWKIQFFGYYSSKIYLPHEKNPHHPKVCELWLRSQVVLFELHHVLLSHWFSCWSTWWLLGIGWRTLWFSHAFPRRDLRLGCKKKHGPVCWDANVVTGFV